MTEEVTKELFIEQMQKFQQDTSEKIVKILQEEEFLLDVEVLGLVATARALIQTYAPDESEDLITSAVYLLTKEE